MTKQERIQELNEMIATATKHIRKGEKLGLKELVRNARRERRRMREELTELLGGN